MVKFLQDTLDCLFDILNSNSEKYDELVFSALVSVTICNHYSPHALCTCSTNASVSSRQVSFPGPYSYCQALGLIPRPLFLLSRIGSHSQVLGV